MAGLMGPSPWRRKTAVAPRHKTDSCVGWRGATSANKHERHFVYCYDLSFACSWCSTDTINETMRPSQMSPAAMVLWCKKKETPAAKISAIIKMDASLPSSTSSPHSLRTTFMRVTPRWTLWNSSWFEEHSASLCTEQPRSKTARARLRRCTRWTSLSAASELSALHPTRRRQSSSA